MFVSQDDLERIIQAYTSSAGTFSRSDPRSTKETTAEEISFHSHLDLKFKAKNIGAASNVLGMELTYASIGIVLTQSQYAEGVCRKFLGSDNRTMRVPLDKPVPKCCDELLLDEEGVRRYQNMLGSLLYLAVCTRPDLFMPWTV